MPKGSIPRSKSGKTWDYLKNRSNIGRPFRAVKGLMDDPPSLTGPIRKEDIERSFDAAGLAVGGGSLVKRPSGSIGMGGRLTKDAVAVAAKDFKQGGARAKFLKDAKAGKIRGTSQSASDLKKGDARSSFLEKAKKGEIKGKAPTQKEGGKWLDLDPKGELSKPYEAPVKDANGRLRPKGYKDGPRPTAEPTAREAPARPKAEPAKDLKKGDLRSKTLEDAKNKSQPPVKKGYNRKAVAVAAAAGGAGLGAFAYKSAPKTSASEDKKKTFGSGYSGYGNKTGSYGPKPVKVESSSTSASGTTDVGGSPKDKMKRQTQGQNPDRKTDKAPDRKPIGVASDKSRVANKGGKNVVQGSKKLSNFERMKMRGYEKEAGMGPSRARSKVSKERSYKFKDLFK